MNGSAERSLVVSLHDVSPLTRSTFEPMLAELRELGVERCSLLVIPDHHHRGHMLADAGFCRWLEGLARQGHEIVAHGYYHQRAPQPTETWRQRLLTRVYTQGEGEFYDLSKEEAAGLLTRAKDDFGKLNVPPPTGFIAPAWLLSGPAREAVREAGFQYTTFLTGLETFAADSGSFIPARSLVYSPRNRWRRVCSLAWNGGLARWLSNATLVRMGLHPPDYRHANLWRQVRRIVTKGVKRRRVESYGSFIGKVRARKYPLI